VVERTAGRFAGLLRKLGRFAPFDPALHTAVEAWPATTRQVPRGRSIARQGEEGRGCLILVSGIAARYGLTVSGKQQILSFHYPGDVLDLPRYFGRDEEAATVAISAVELAAVPHRAIRQTAADHPALAEALLADTLVEAAIGREWLLNVGQRTATARLAHLLCEAALRLSASGYGEPSSFDFPFTQAHLAAAAGLTAVHVNRTLRVLTESGLIAYDVQRVTIHDVARLRSVGDFDPAYLRDIAPDVAAAVRPGAGTGRRSD